MWLFLLSILTQTASDVRWSQSFLHFPATLEYMLQNSHDITNQKRLKSEERRSDAKPSVRVAAAANLNFPEGFLDFGARGIRIQPLVPEPGNESTESTVC